MRNPRAATVVKARSPVTVRCDSPCVTLMQPQYGSEGAVAGHCTPPMRTGNPRAMHLHGMAGGWHSARLLDSHPSARRPLGPSPSPSASISLSPPQSATRAAPPCLSPPLPPLPPCQRHSGTTYMLSFLKTNLDPGIKFEDRLCAIKHRMQVAEGAGHVCVCGWVGAKKGTYVLRGLAAW